MPTTQPQHFTQRFPRPPSATQSYANILLVHDRTQHQRDLAAVIHAMRTDLRCTVAISLSEADQILEQDAAFDVVIVDLAGVGLTGIGELRASHPNLNLMAFEFPGCDVSAERSLAEILVGVATLETPPRYASTRAPAKLAMAGIPEPATQPLTRRELDVVCLIRDGLPNKSIATTLGITEGTVKVYARAIFRKLGVRNRTQAARSAEALLGVIDSPVALERGLHQ